MPGNVPVLPIASGLALFRFISNVRLNVFCRLLFCNMFRLLLLLLLRRNVVTMAVVASELAGDELPEI